MLKKSRVIPLVILFVLLFGGASVGALEVPKDVRVNDNGVETLYSTDADTVGEFFAKEKIVINKTDYVDGPMEEEILENYVTEVNIARGFNVKVLVDEAPQIVSVPAGTTAGALIAEIEKNNGLEYTYDGKLTQILKKDQVIELESVKVHDLVTTELIPYTTEEVLDGTMTIGEKKVIQPGKKGTVEKLNRITNEGGVKSTEIISETVIAEPVNEIVHVGTAEPVVGPKAETYSNGNLNFKYTQAIDMKASAYTAGPESTGKSPGDPGYGVTASGMKAEHGVVAVDPDVIPLGTKLYIENYGYAIAGDTGGAIDGNKIDLFYEDLNDALNFGRRDVQVYVLA